ncbi:uroporphyrinogen-III C-methyltransferase [Vibrio navarrensis]|nr:uroporphyrinogen-III C-methyltransferase [Vibrio navarrensis]EJL6564905.1 uroporphyrinogen-III C-methyltransferase [Vibrio navarrensis]
MESKTTRHSLESSYSKHMFLDAERFQVEHAALSKSPNQRGFVSLVGAGPGDPDLLTVKALKALQRCDMVVYDRLVSQEILDLIPASAEKIYVGKRCGEPSLKQAEINQILLQFAKQGRQIVRLKGGDPFIFGRGGEEALALAEHNIPYTVVPGITAAIGCAASCAIPLTHREMARSVTLVTGTVVTGQLPAWSAIIAAGQTLVFYMGLESARAIEQGLRSHGVAADFPVAIVTQGSTPLQQTHVTQLAALEKTALKLKGISPALIIIGEVITLRDKLITTLDAVAWQASQPLTLDV